MLEVAPSTDKQIEESGVSWGARGGFSLLPKRRCYGPFSLERGGHQYDGVIIRPFKKLRIVLSIIS